MRKFFVEIGSCDTDTLIPLAENGWSGIIVEPISQYLDSLPRYDHVVYENSVITDVDGEVPFWYYDPSLADATGEHWIKGVGNTSVDINHFHSNPQWKAYERRIMVNSLTLDSLFRKYNVNSVDFMKIDVEGEEIGIFKNYSWDVKPSMMKIETAHWDARGQHRGIHLEGQFLSVLKSKGYIVWFEKKDLYAIG